MARRRNQRASRLLVAALAGWFGVIPSLAFVHLRSTPHWFCPEHLRFEDMQVTGRSGARPPSDPAHTGVERDASSARRTHIRCDISNDFSNGSALSASRQLVVVARPDPSIAAPVASRAFAPIVLLGLAPKHSPPAPLV